MINTVIKTEDGDFIFPGCSIYLSALPNKGDTIDFDDKIYEVVRINYVAIKSSFNIDFFPEIIVKQII